MPKNLLLVDDEEDIVSLLEDIFEGKMDNIYCAYNGKDGLDILKDKDIGCIVSDLSMPIMDGLAFLKEVRETKNNVPFIFLSAYGSKDNQDKAQNLGAFGFVEKLNFDSIKDIVERAFKAYEKSKD